MGLRQENSTTTNLIRSIIIGFTGILALLIITSCASAEKNVLQPAPSQDVSSTHTTPIFYVIAINATSTDCYYNDPQILGEINPSSTDMPNISNFYQALNKIPGSLMQVMDNKTFYLSYQSGAGYAVLGSWPEHHILSQVEKGCILEQPITESQVLHEFGHILDYDGIRGIYEDANAYWTDLESIRSELFDQGIGNKSYYPVQNNAPPGFIDTYAATNSAENFAEHFAAYVIKGEEFRNLASGNELLTRKYIFFKYFLFNGKEYGLVTQTSK